MAGNVAGNVVSSAESVVNTASSVVSNASSLAKNTLQPLVFDPLRLQNSDSILDKEQDSQSNRVWKQSMVWVEIMLLVQFSRVVLKR